MIYAGIDIGGTNIKAGLVDENADLIVKRNVPFPKRGYEVAAEVIEELIRDMIKEKKGGMERLSGIGLAVPGSIDAAGEVVLNAFNLDFHNVALKAEIERRFPNTSVFLLNDANAAALAELYQGAFRGCKTAVLFTLGTGIGGGLILGGKMFNGGLNHGVELGHMILIHDGPPCSCGNRGCMETVCTATWLMQQGRKVFLEGKESMIVKRAKGDLSRVNAKTVLDSAKQGDPTALKIFNQYIDYLSSAVASVISLLDPEVIALGGGISLTGDFLFDALREKVREKTFFQYNYNIVPAVMGNDAGMIGAAMVFQNFL